MKYSCELCGLVYNEEAGYSIRGIAPGTRFENLPDTFCCPSCGSEKEAFTPIVPRKAQPRLEDPAFWNQFKYSDEVCESDR